MIRTAHSRAAGVLVLCGLVAGCARSMPFTREGVLTDLHGRYQGIALPSDDEVPGVTRHLGLAYARRGDKDLVLDLFVPAGAGPHPAVIVIHGGGWKSGDHSMERPFARQLAARGLAAATVQYRLGPEGRFPNALQDLKESLRWLRANSGQFGIDPARLGAVGMSAGGQLAALLGALNEDGALRAVVDIDGLADFAGAALLAREVRTPGAPTLFLGGGFIERSDVWRAASALYQVNARSAPTLFINSTGPSPILPGREQMRDRLRALGIDSDILVMPGTPHPFWLVHPWFVPTTEATARFLRRHLEVGPAATPPESIEAAATSEVKASAATASEAKE